MKRLAIILLAGMAFAQDKPKETPKPEVKLPEISVEYQDKFKTLVIKQQNLRIDESNLQRQFDADEKALALVNTEGLAIEAKLMAELKLDPKKYTTLYKDDKMIIVERQEKK